MDDIKFIWRAGWKVIGHLADFSKQKKQLIIIFSMPLLFLRNNSFIAFFVSLFIVWRIWKKPAPAFLAAITAGFLIDVDHWLDYFLAFGFNINLEAFFSRLSIFKDR